MSADAFFWSPVRRLPWGGLLTLPIAGLLWQSFFWLDRVPLVTKAAYAGLAILSAVQPAAGLLVTAALATLGAPFASLVGAPRDRTAEALMLTFLVGWLARRVVRREPVLDADDTLSAPLALFGLTVAASLVVTSAAVQSSTSPPLEYVRIAGALLARNYLGWAYFETHNWYSAALLFEGGLLCAAVLQITRKRPDLQSAVARMLAVGVVAAALFSLARMSTGLLRTDDASAYLIRMMTAVRLSEHTADVNAAGSHFVLALPLLWALGVVAGRWRPAWMLSVGAVVGALWLTGSRAAQFSILLLTASLAVAGRRRSVTRIVVVIAGLIVVVGAVIVSRPGPESSIVATLNNRWLFSQLSWEMFTSAPLFGIGISEYYTHSEALMPAGLRALYVAENAHNNFAQIGVELGAVGLALFLAVLVSAWRRIRRGWAAVPDPLLRGLSLGLAAALLTFLVGHPLLIGVFASSFWLALALAVARADSVSRQPAAAVPSAQEETGRWHPARWTPRTVAVVALALIASVPIRAHVVRDDVNLSNVRFGFARGGEDAVTKDQFRWAGPHATLFVTTRAQTLLLSVSSASEAEPLELELRIDGRLANRVVLRETFWRDMRLIMPVNGSTNPFWRIDLLVRRLAGDSQDGSSRSDSAGPRIRVRAIIEK